MDKRSIAAALIGHALERYDVVLYGFFASMLAPIFFHQSSNIALLSSMGTFAAGYLMRPLGGIVFGLLGDRYGRKRAFLWSIMLVVIPTFIIGILPTYQEIGILAPIILITCRLMQGFCAGGEFSGAAIFVGEHANKKHAGLAGSFICAIGFLGVALGTGIASITTLPIFAHWGWRIPFLIGAFLTLVSYFLRRKMNETPDFLNDAIKTSHVKNPLLEVLKNWKKNLLITMAIGACGHIFLYTTTVYMSTSYKHTFQLPPHIILKFDTILVLFWMLIVLLMGALSDKIGIRRLMNFSLCLVILFSFPIFYYLDQHFTIENLFTCQIILIVLCSGFFGPATAIFTELFPTTKRYSGIAFGITLGQAIFGGTTPLINELLVSLTGDRRAPSLYVMLGAIITLFSLRKLPHLTKNNLS